MDLLDSDFFTFYFISIKTSLRQQAKSLADSMKSVSFCFIILCGLNPFDHLFIYLFVAIFPQGR